MWIRKEASKGEVIARAPSPELREARERSLDSMARTQSSAYKGLYSSVGAAIMGVALFTAFSLREFLPNSVIAMVLILISFFVGALTILYGYYQARIVMEAARHQSLVDSFAERDEELEYDENVHSSSAVERRSQGGIFRYLLRLYSSSGRHQRSTGKGW